MVYIKEIINHQIGDNTPFEKVAQSLGWTIQKQENEVEKAYDGSLWEKGYAPEKLQEVINQERIEELKALLVATDYCGQKYIDGEYTAEEWEEKKAQRKAWREEIRSLENSVDSGV